MIAAVVILAFSVWAIVLPDEARITMRAAVDWIALNLGWYYVLTVTLVIGFVLWVALSKEAAAGTAALVSHAAAGHAVPRPRGAAGAG